LSFGAATASLPAWKPKRSKAASLAPFDEILSEVRPLGSAVNQALDRLDLGFRVQREFAADAAHELRTPLSILRTRVDTLKGPGTAQALHEDIEAMSRIVGQLLAIAELDAFTIDPLELADAHGVCAEVTEFIAPLALLAETRGLSPMRKPWLGSFQRGGLSAEASS
jgi:signal transduction histidine kinase